MEEWIHKPVLYREVVDSFDFGDRRVRFIDGTLGNGGHSGMLLERFPNLELLGIDRDGDALERAAEHLKFAERRVTLVRGDFSDMTRLAMENGWDKVDGILLDIGVSSPQLDDGRRGFSWRMDGPLDMRMDQRSEVTASRLLNRMSEAELEEIFREYGEVRQSRKLARAVVARREENPFATTGDLVALCDDVLGHSRGRELPSPTLAFQGLRIAVNDELGELERALDAAVELLNLSGRMAVISFHSLEDRMVKRFVRGESSTCTCPPGMPVCICGKVARLKSLSNKAIVAKADELESNRRAACAKMRVAERV